MTWQTSSVLAADRDARLSDARIATAASLFIGVVFCSAPRPHISRTPPDPCWRRDHDNAPGNACCEADQCEGVCLAWFWRVCVPAHVYTVNVYYESLQLTSSMHKAKDNGHRAHGQKEIKHAYGPKSTPIAQGLVDDINAMHAYGWSSAPIAHELVYDINAPHAFWAERKKTKDTACLRA